MKTELKIILDEIRSDESSEINPALLYPYLQKSNYLVPNELFMIERATTLTAQLNQIFEFLKTKDDKVFIVLQKICHGYNVDLFNLIQTKLKEIGRDDLIWQPLFSFNVDPNLSKKDKLETVQLSLKDHYEHDLELIRNYWRKFGVLGNLTMDNFYNQNIIVKDKNDKQTTFKDFDQLFSTDSRRFIISADAGYGKSTFVHEMARQWVKGEHSWTKKFSILFLTRLSEVTEAKTNSLESFLTMCLSPDDAGKVKKLMENKRFMKSCLFIFDGFDEFHEQGVKIAGEIDDIISGRGPKLAHVVITSRPCKKIKELDDKIVCNNLYIELKGYTEDGVNIQLQKFGIHPKYVEDDLRDVLKVPLFNTLFCITHKEGTVGCLSICTAIEKFVNFACRRHRNLNPNFTDIEENEIIIMLGQAAQYKFLFIYGVNVEYPNDTTQHLSTAISIGLVSEKSTETDFIFAHQTIAEYCAAYYWYKKSPLKVKNFDCTEVDFAEPEGGGLSSAQLFSCFLCHLNDEYKQFLWQNFNSSVPLFDEYDSLPKRTLETSELMLRFMPVSHQYSMMKKIEFSSQNPFVLNCANFESGKKFENITKLNHLPLRYCTFKICPEEFFHSYNIIWLQFYLCTFNEWETVGEDLKEIWKNDLRLEYLNISFCNNTVVKFLSFIMRHCTTLKTFELCCVLQGYMMRQGMIEMESGCNFNFYGEGWILELQNNKKLIHSIEHFDFGSIYPVDLTILFETLGRMINLKTLVLRVKKRRLSEAESNSLKLSFKNGLKKLEYLVFNLIDKDGKEINENKFRK